MLGCVAGWASGFAEPDACKTRLRYCHQWSDCAAEAQEQRVGGLWPTCGGRRMSVARQGWPHAAMAVARN